LGILLLLLGLLRTEVLDESEKRHIGYLDAGVVDPGDTLLVVVNVRDGISRHGVYLFAKSNGYFVRPGPGLLSDTGIINATATSRLGDCVHWAFTPTDPMDTTVRRISGMGGDRIVVCNRFTYDPSMQVSGARLDSVAAAHRRTFQARFPMLEGVEMEHCWGGRLCLSLNGVSTVGKLAEGVYSACCQNGLGTARGTLSGILAAEQASGATTHWCRGAARCQHRPAPVSSVIIAASSGCLELLQD